MRRMLKTAILVALWAFMPGPSQAAVVTLTATGVGFMANGDVAAARDRAVRDAQVRALEKAMGVIVDARTALHKSLLIDDTVLTRTKGMIRSYRVLKEGKAPHGLYGVTIEAHVDRVVMADELVRMAGEKRVLLVRADKSSMGDAGDRILLGALAEAFSNAGFKLARTILPRADFRLMDGEKVRKLAEETGNDLVVRLQLEEADPECPTENFCACRANGSARLYEGGAGTLLAAETVEDIRGFGNTASTAAGDVLKKGAKALVDSMMGQLLFPGKKKSGLWFGTSPTMRIIVPCYGP